MIKEDIIAARNHGHGYALSHLDVCELLRLINKPALWAAHGLGEGMNASVDMVRMLASLLEEPCVRREKRSPRCVRCMSRGEIVERGLCVPCAMESGLHFEMW